MRVKAGRIPGCATKKITVRGIWVLTGVFIWLLLAAAHGATGAPDSPVKEVYIGLLAMRGEETTQELWQPTADYLSQSVDGYHFTIVPLTNDSLGRSIGAGAVDFVLSNPASYATLEKTDGITRLVTLKNRRLGELIPSSAR